VSRNPLISVFTACILALALGQNQAQAQVKPFKVTGGGVVDYIPLQLGVEVSHTAVGEATELGRYHGLGTFQLDRFTGPSTAEFSSSVPFVFVAASGDELAFTYGDINNGAQQPGQVGLFPVAGGRFVGVFVAEFNPVPALSTGRFAKVIGGSFIMVAVTEPFVLGATDPVRYTWQGDGWLEFRTGRR
jgi:hypothetical protein